MSYYVGSKTMEEYNNTKIRPFITCMLWLSIMCTVIYARNTSDQREHLLEYIGNQSSSMSLPWDFSAILYNNVRINDGEFNLSADLDFMDSVFQPLAWLNHVFERNKNITWRGGANCSIHSKIDPLFITYECYNRLPALQIHFLNHSVSDHSPIFFQIVSTLNNQRKYHSRYNNAWSMQLGYKGTI